MSEPVCLYCDHELVVESAVLFPGSEDVEDVWVCKNKDCDYFDETIYNRGDLDE